MKLRKKQDLKIASRPERCRLCLEERELRNSHVIPEFIYKALGVYDEKHRFCGFSNRPEDGVETHQKGFREYLLCEVCERRLNVWETYARRVLFGDEGLEFSVLSGQPSSAMANGVDYERFKLFSMSLIWRAGIASGEMFELVDLGPHAEKLRTLLLGADPGPYWRYGCGILMAPHENLDGEAPFSRAIDNPEPLRFKSHRVYRFMMGRMFWLFPLSGEMHNLRRDGFYFSLFEDGRLMMYDGGEVANAYLTKVAVELAAADRKRESVDTE